MDGLISDSSSRLRRRAVLCCPCCGYILARGRPCFKMEYCTKYTVYFAAQSTKLIKVGEAMPVPTSKRAANNRWDAANMSVLSVKLRKERADVIRDAAAAAGQTVSAYILQAINERIERDKQQTP